MVCICRDTPGKHLEKTEDLSPNMIVQVQQSSFSCN